MTVKPKTKYVMGLDVITAQAAFVQWLGTRLANNLGYGYGIENFSDQWTANEAQAYWARAIPIHRDMIETVIKGLVMVAAPLYPKAEIIMYTRQSVRSATYDRVKAFVDQPEYSDPNWQTRTKARVWLIDHQHTEQQIITGLANQSTPSITIARKE